jgi:hypothetical protein
MADSLDPDVVWFGTRGGLDEGQVLRGPDAWLEYMREIQDPWSQPDYLQTAQISRDCSSPSWN